MDFCDFTFIFRFLPVFLLAYYALPDRYRNSLLLIGSVVYYAFVSLPCAAVLLLIVGINYFTASVMPHTKPVLALGVAINVLLLVFFKIGPFSMPGISFISFGMIAFLVDAFKSGTDEFPGFPAYAVMFPKLISGPITRYSELAPALREKKDIRGNVEAGFELFVLGLAYKALLADRLAGLWNQVQTIGFISISTPLAWLGAIGFSLQLYFDFQGYSLMAIGLGRMLGFIFPDNFDSPYCARSVSEFYRRWHITLGRWFRDYVYIPLGGSRRGMLKTLINLLLVWALTGLWHGIGWNFLIWAGVLFFFIALEKLFLGKLLKRLRILPHIYTVLVVVVSWVPFAITKLEDLLVYLSRMFAPIIHSEGINVYALDYIKYGKLYGPFLIAGIIFALPWPERLIRKFSGKWFIVLLMLVLFWFALYEIAINSNNPFMYFKF